MKNTAKNAAARVTKKEAYAKYGIVYKGGKILSPVGWINELLKQGNEKTGKEVWTFSTLPGKRTYEIEINGELYAISGTCACTCEGCYAMTGHYNHDTVKRSIGINTLLVNKYIDFVEAAISAQLEYIGRGEVRIHAAGDFKTENPEAYASMWYRIAADFPSFRFWTYTKVVQYETLFDDLKNANVVKSIIPKVGVNFGHCEYIINAYYTLRAMGKSVYICRCGIDKNQHCANCGVCTAYEHVLFVEHSTGYIAENDPYYSKLVALIQAQ